MQRPGIAARRSRACRALRVQREYEKRVDPNDKGAQALLEEMRQHVKKVSPEYTAQPGCARHRHNRHPAARDPTCRCPCDCSSRICARTRTLACRSPPPSSRRHSASSPTASRYVFCDRCCPGAVPGLLIATALFAPAVHAEKLWEAGGVGTRQGSRLVHAAAAQARQAGAPPRCVITPWSTVERRRAYFDREWCACMQVDVDGKPWPLDAAGNPVLK